MSRLQTSTESVSRLNLETLLPLIVIVGPTASGKSALAVKLAKKFNGEIVSADSRQVYRGLDIGSAKVTRREMDGIAHHLLDIASPKRAMSAGKFQRLAARAIAGIAGRRKVPFLVGGTAFWVDTVAYGLRLPEVRPDPALRKRLAAKSATALLAILKKLDPARAETIEQKNPRRLIRAIEIASALGRVPHLVKHSMFDTLWFGLKPSYEVGLHKMVERVDKMLRRGLVAETKKLLASGVSKKRIRELGFEYRAALDYIEGEIPSRAPLEKKFLTGRAALSARLARDTLAYAKRQMRWWKRNRDIHWIKNPKEAELRIKIFLQKTA